MNTDHKFTLAVGVLALVAILFAGYAVMKKRQGTEFASQTESQSMVEEKNSPPTGSADETASEILNELDAEQKLLTEQESDLNLVTSDSQIINDFGATYNENEL